MTISRGVTDSDDNPFHVLLRTRKTATCFGVLPTDSNGVNTLRFPASPSTPPTTPRRAYHEITQMHSVRASVRSRTSRVRIGYSSTGSRISRKKMGCNTSKETIPTVEEKDNAVNTEEVKKTEDEGQIQQSQGRE
ncbi:hypothetical protein QE152_g36076 [Popillia japonica]|uniref:Uncharacterized protein n=1 Tax=Popillia japonica TaxID=7064 RepID=A0AAW1IDI0_POPJA